MAARSPSITGSLRGRTFAGRLAGHDGVYPGRLRKGPQVAVIGEVALNRALLEVDPSDLRRRLEIAGKTIGKGEVLSFPRTCRRVDGDFLQKANGFFVFSVQGQRKPKVVTDGKVFRSHGQRLPVIGLGARVVTQAIEGDAHAVEGGGIFALPFGDLPEFLVGRLRLAEREQRVSKLAAGVCVFRFQGEGRAQGRGGVALGAHRAQGEAEFDQGLRALRVEQVGALVETDGRSEIAARPGARRDPKQGIHRRRFRVRRGGAVAIRRASPGQQEQAEKPATGGPTKGRPKKFYPRHAGEKPSAASLAER